MLPEACPLATLTKVDRFSLYLYLKLKVKEEVDFKTTEIPVDYLKRSLSLQVAFRRLRIREHKSARRLSDQKRSDEGDSCSHFPDSILGHSTNRNRFSTADPMQWYWPEEKELTRVWLLRILQVEIRYTPLGSRTLRHPLRCSLRFGKTSLLGLVDTGSDYDALHSGLFSVLEEKEPSIVIDRSKVNIGDVVGFVNSCKMKTTGECRTIRVIVEGAAKYLSPHPKRKSLDIPFNLFDGLSEPFVLGMPSIDHSGGIELLSKHICLAGVWIPRALPGQLG